MNKFDKVVDRKNTNTEKWDGMERKYNREDLLPLWIADMDFEVSKEISEKVEKRARHNVYGYAYCTDEYYDAIIDWMDRKHDWKVEKEWITYTPGIISAISFSIDALTNPGDNIIVQTPVYDPFYTVIEDNGCHIKENPLIFKDGRYTMDFDDLESKIDERTKLMLLCSPHNPIGRVWTKEELERVVEICLEHDIKIICDEIHSEIIFDGFEHTNLATLSKEVEDNCIICTSPTKAFNIAGLQVANLIIANEDIRDRVRQVINKNHFVRPSIFGVEGLIAAYNESEYWLDEVTEYIEGNKDYFIDYLDKNIDGIEVVRPEGSYVLWVDFSKLGMNEEELNRFLLEECRLATIDGGLFGDAGRLFQRINIACPRSYLTEALDRIKEGLEKRKD